MSKALTYHMSEELFPLEKIRQKSFTQYCAWCGKEIELVSGDVIYGNKWYHANCWSYVVKRQKSKVTYVENSKEANPLLQVQSQQLPTEKTNDTSLSRNYKRSDIENHTHILCYSCNQEIQLYWEPRYNGLRGGCNNCGTNWPES